MVLRTLLRMLFAHPQVGPQLIQRLSETRPIRAAARFTAYLYLRSKAVLEDKAKQLDVDKFKKNLEDEIKKGFQEAQKKNNQKKN